MKKMICAACGVLGASAALAAAPELVGFSSVQSMDAVVTTTFTLQGEAILTADVKTNGVSIGWRNFRSAMKGATLNRVNPAGTYTLTWNPADSWTDVPPRLPAGMVSIEVRAWSPDDPPTYMDVDLAQSKSVAYYCDADDLPVPVTDDLYKTTHLLMRRIPAANKTFLMGSPAGEDRRSKRVSGDGVTGTCEDQCSVSLSHDFYMAVYEWTQGQQKAIGRSVADGQSAVGDRYPLANLAYDTLRVFWTYHWPNDGHTVWPDGIVDVIRKRTGISCDLPTEAQWEFACRAGTTSAYCDGTSTTDTLGNYAVFSGNAPKNSSGNVTCAEVGTKAPNGFGLYDMIGNVSEFCVEQRTDYAAGAMTDPKGVRATTNGDNAKMVNRGSNYTHGDSSDFTWSDVYGVAIIEHRSAFRGEYWCTAKQASATLGFRLIAPVSRQWPTVTVAAGTVAQDASRRVAVTYDLTADAIVTLELYQDGERVSDEALRAVCGDVNRIVKADGQTKCIYWTPDISWPKHVLDGGHLSFKVRQWAPNDPPAYMVLDLTQSAVDTTAYYASAEAFPEPVTNDIWKTDYLVMRRIPAKDVVWQMGVSTNAAGKSVEDVGYDTSNSKPHRVRLSQDFYMSIFELTRRQTRVTGDDASKEANRADWTKPYSGKWLDLRYDNGTYRWPSTGHQVAANSGMDKFRQRFGLQFDYPTEAQWEFACRAGTDGRYHGFSSAGECAWYSGNSGNVLHPVGQKKPNAWGLYDMLGNAFEHCLDGFSANYGLTDAQLASETVDPYGPYPLSDDNKPMRGGSYGKADYECRSGDRSVSNHWSSNWGNTGFRLVCPLPGETFAEPVLP